MAAEFGAEALDESMPLTTGMVIVHGSCGGHLARDLYTAAVTSALATVSLTARLIVLTGAGTENDSDADDMGGGVSGGGDAGGRGGGGGR